MAQAIPFLLLATVIQLRISASAPPESGRLSEEVIEVPEIQFPNVDIDKAASDINNALKEAAYIAVGLGVLAFQKAQVRRLELAKQLEGLPETISSQMGQMDEYLAPARQRVRSAGTQFAGDLTDFSRSMEEALDPLRAQLLELARFLEELMGPARQQLDEQIDRLEQSLPDGARSVVKSVRSTASAQEQTWRRSVGLE
jgi:hypothetical protein